MIFEYFQNEPNQANYGSRENVNVYLSVLNLNFRDPRSGALKVGLTEVRPTFYQHESLILAQDERWRRA